MVTNRLVAAVLLAAAGCSDRASDAPHPRIISYSPGVTDILYDLGLGDHVVGVTSWCMLPEGQSKPVVGSALSPNTEMILALEPDLIFCQQDPSKLEAVRRRRPEVRIVAVPVRGLDEQLAAVAKVAEAAGAPAAGQRLTGRIEARLAAVRRRAAGRDRPRTLFLLGHDRPATAGRGTMIDGLIGAAGGVNAAAERYERWPTINAEMIQALRPEVIVCQVNSPSEATRARRHLGSLSLPAGCRIVVTTDRRVTLLGSRVGEVAELFAEAIHPSAATRPGGAASGEGPR